MAEPSRVIARPSERRRPGPVRAGAIDLRDASHASSPTTSHSTTNTRSIFSGIGALSILVAAAAYGFLGITGAEPTTAGIILVPAMAAATHIAMRAAVERSIGTEAMSILFAGLGLRLLAAVPRLMGGVDAPVYFREGDRLTDSFRSLNFVVDTGRAIPGTGSVRYLAGLLNVLTGSTYVATYLLFVLLAFVGQVFFVAGFRPALDDRQFRILTILVMASPTLAFWPSSIGKEAVVLFGTGLAIFGASRLATRRAAGLGVMIAGVAAVGMVRPHVALVLLAAVLVGLFSRRSDERSRVVAHVAVVVVLVGGSMWASTASAQLFGLEGLDGFSDVSAALDFAQQRTSQDRAAFVAPRVDTPADYPWAVVTVLFRPFPWEAPNALALVSAVESTLLAGLVVAAIPGTLRRRQLIVRSGQLLSAIAFIAVFAYVFSAIGNFGILSRQRAQVVPFVLVLVSIGLGIRRGGRAS